MSPHRKRNVRRSCSGGFSASYAPFDDIHSFCKSSGNHEAGAPCAVVSLFSPYYYCLHMLPLAMHSRVMGPAVNREPLTQVRAMLFRRVITPWALMASMGHTVRCDYGRDLNGAKHNTAGMRLQRFDRPHGECCRQRHI